MPADFGPTDPWPVRWPCDVSTSSPAVTGMAVRAATAILWARTGQRFGTSTVKLRPCRRSCRDTPYPGHRWEPWPGTYYGLTPYYQGWGVVECGCGSCTGTCSCNSLSEVLMPAVVNRVLEVRLDGAPVASGVYRVDDNMLLVRTDGGSWPRCQNLALDDTQAGTFSVTATFGEDPPDDAAFAVGELACEYVKFDRGEDCSLPRYLTGLARQGVSITLPDLSGTLGTSRLLGLRVADMFITTWNPAGLVSDSRAFSVDAVLARRAGT